jgi:VTC domain-containing protein
VTPLSATTLSELKFIVSEETANSVHRLTRVELAPDPHAAGTLGEWYQTASIYFDTPEYDLFYGRASTWRSEFRIRRYNDSSALFVERKLKKGDRIFKRRTPVSLDELQNLRGDHANWAGGWFGRRLSHRRLLPVCRIAYRRAASVGTTAAGPLRLTIDHAITASAVDDVSFTDEGAIDVLPSCAIVEFKYRGPMPDLFKRVVDVFELQPHRVSKYRLSVHALGLATLDEAIGTNAG